MFRDFYLVMCNVINYTEYISSETMQQDVNSFARGNDKILTFYLTTEKKQVCIPLRKIISFCNFILTAHNTVLSTALILRTASTVKLMLYILTDSSSIT